MNIITQKNKVFYKNDQDKIFLFEAKPKFVQQKIKNFCLDKSDLTILKKILLDLDLQKIPHFEVLDKIIAQDLPKLADRCRGADVYNTYGQAYPILHLPFIFENNYYEGIFLKTQSFINIPYYLAI